MSEFIEIDRRFEEEEYKGKVKDLLDRGFQEWPEGIALTKTKFSATAMFETVESSTAEEEERKVFQRVEAETGKKWQVVSIVEIYDQKQKRLHVFLRQKYGVKTLTELSEKIKVMPSVKYDPNNDNYLSWVLQALEEGSVEKARVDFEQQRGKFEVNSELYNLLCEALYDDEVLSPRDSIKKWQGTDET